MNKLKLLYWSALNRLRKSRREWPYLEQFYRMDTLVGALVLLREIAMREMVENVTEVTPNEVVSHYRNRIAGLNWAISYLKTPEEQVDRHIRETYKEAVSHE